MKLEKAVKILKEFNDFRKDREIPPVTRSPRPRDITKALDIVINYLENKNNRIEPGGRV